MIVKEEAHRKLVCNIDTGSEAVVFATPKSVQCTHCFKPGHEAKNCYLLIEFPDWSLEYKWGDWSFDGDSAGGRRGHGRNSYTQGRSCGDRGWGDLLFPAGLTWIGQSDPAEAASFSSFATLSTYHSCECVAAASVSTLEDAEHSSAAQTVMTVEPGSRHGPTVTGVGKPLSVPKPAVQPTSAHLSSAHNPEFQSAPTQLTLAQPPSAHLFTAHLVMAQLPAAQESSTQQSANPHPPAQSPVLLAQHPAAHKLSCQ
ncbi:hypothetical protein M9H77_08312 [Catharanthus roseus]|uniref:Uncharacterized protein n=1 Tax=Catharanthus roseus TaxID=4058 RepID=A0ACC0BXC5_CATRO|nr:hypothetical protein M9H77_08312 [Catharanthus roseus]